MDEDSQVNVRTVFGHIYGGGPDAIALFKRRTSKIMPSERIKMTQSSRSRKEIALARVRELEKELAFLARFPDDNFPEHTVLMTWKTYSKDVPVPHDELRQYGIQGWAIEKQDVTYTYVLLKAGGQWWATGTNGHGINGASWDRVIEFIDEDDLIDVRTGRSVMLDSDDVNPKLNDRDALADAVETAATKAD